MIGSGSPNLKPSKYRHQSPHLVTCRTVGVEPAGIGGGEIVFSRDFSLLRPVSRMA
jgi:hypothetical protein